MTSRMKTFVISSDRGQFVYELLNDFFFVAEPINLDYFFSNCVLFVMTVTIQKSLTARDMEGGT